MAATVVAMETEEVMVGNRAASRAVARDRRAVARAVIAVGVMAGTVGAMADMATRAVAAGLAEALTDLLARLVGV